MSKAMVPKKRMQGQRGANSMRKKASSFQHGVDELQKQYPSAMTFDPTQTQDGTTYEPLPAEYESNIQGHEDYLTKRQMMSNRDLNQAAGSGIINYNIDQNDVNVHKEMEKVRRQYEYHKYLDQHIDPRKPGHLQWLMEIEPDYIKQKLKALNSSMRLMEKKIRLKAFGVQSTEDMRLKYLLDNKMLQDDREATPENRYVKGFFAPKYNVPRVASRFTNMLGGATYAGINEDRQSMLANRAPDGGSFFNEAGTTDGASVHPTAVTGYPWPRGQ